MLYSKIYNQYTNTWYNVRSPQGKSMLNNYLLQLLKGGSSPAPSTARKLDYESDTDLDDWLDGDEPYQPSPNHASHVFAPKKSELP